MREQSATMNAFTILATVVVLVLYFLYYQGANESCKARGGVLVGRAMTCVKKDAILR